MTEKMHDFVKLKRTNSFQKCCGHWASNSESRSCLFAAPLLPPLLLKENRSRTKTRQEEMDAMAIVQLHEVTSGVNNLPDHLDFKDRKGPWTFSSFLLNMNLKLQVFIPLTLLRHFILRKIKRLGAVVGYKRDNQPPVARHFTMTGKVVTEIA